MEQARAHHGLVGHLLDVDDAGKLVIDGKTIEEYHREAGDKVLSAAIARFAGTGVEHSPHLLVGEAAPAIVEFARSKGCDMIVMGTHGFSTVMGLIMGSVATKVIHLATMPVLLVK